jgi:anti-anti-sigma factor
MPVEVREEARGPVVVLEVRGRVDSASAPVLQERLAGALGTPGTHLVLDLAALEFLTSAGFRVLLMAGKQAGREGRRLVLCGLSPRVHQLFEIGGFLDLFRIVPAREEAVTAARDGV